MIGAFVFAAFAFFAIVFQFCLVAGLPWGRAAMGGRFPGQLPTPARVAAVVQALFLAGLALVVMARAGLVLPTMRDWAQSGVWGVVAISVVSLVLNLATPSRIERMIWAPVALVLTLSSLAVALEL